MTIRITRNAEGNCINFVGSSQPAYWNACLSAAINSDNTDLINVINDIRSANDSQIEYEFYAVPFTDFSDKDGNSFATAQEAVDYINVNANVTGVSDTGSDLSNTSVNFRLDETSTSIILDNGASFGVNTIKAVPDEDGTIHIHAIGGGLPSGVEEPTDHKYYEKLNHTAVSVNGQAVAGGLNDVVNTLNELFTVGAFEAVVISDPFSTMVADVGGEAAGYSLEGNTAIDPAGDDIFTNSSSGNYAGLKSTATINQAGEYFTFDIRGEGEIGFGLIHTDASYAAGYYIGNSNYADPDSFAVSNSAHYGFQFSHWFDPTPDGSWTNYGASTGFIYGPGWNNWDKKQDWLDGTPVKMRVGLDENGFIAIYSQSDTAGEWILHARSSYPVPEGSEFYLGVKIASNSSRVATAPKVHRLDVASAPTTLGTDAITVFEDPASSVLGTLSGGISYVGDDNSGDNDGFVSSQVINASGEYFQFTWSAGDFNFGLFSENDHNVADLQADRSDWGNDDYIYFGARGENNGTVNSFYSENDVNKITLQGEIGNYYGRIGFDSQGKPSIWASTDGITWVQKVVGTGAAPAGDYKFIWIAQDANCDLTSLTQGTLTMAPVMSFRYAESPDGVFHYPLFATEEEANYYDQNHDGTTGSGTSHTEVFPDDPTFATWYMPDTGSEGAGSTAPTGSFMGTPITWTEITTLTDADMAPAAFSAQTVSVDENSAVNIQIHPQGASWTTTITDPSGNFTLDNFFNVIGTAPVVTDDNVANPSDDYDVTVTRTNSYGSSTGTLTISVQNLTAPFTTLTGFNWDNTSAAMIDGSTLASGSVVHMNSHLTDGKRMIFDKSWIETNVLPRLTTVGDKFFIGIAGSHDWTDGVQTADFNAHLSIERLANDQFRSDIVNGTTNSVTVSSLTDAFYDYAFEYDGSDIHVIACNVDQINTEPAINDGGSFSRYVTGTGFSGQQTIHIGVQGGTAALSSVTTIDIPTPAPTILTNWNKALDFSGGSEYALMVSSNTSNQPIAQSSGITIFSADQTKTVSSSSGRPWATACVFKSDLNSSNQHVWNQGEGAGSTDDNIYLRADASGKLYFGWGRDGALNECLVHPDGTNTNWTMTQGNWYGVYIAFTGERLSGSDATAANLAGCFDIRLLGSSNSWATTGSPGTNLSTSSRWSAGTTGGRMDRTVVGSFTIGGRGGNRNFHGKVASFVSTTLKLNVNMPDMTEIEMMVTDPMQWIQDYKVGQTYRRTYQGTNSTNWQVGSTGSVWYPSNATQVWLMGDGGNDSYANMIRNRANPGDQNYTKLQLNSMVSNDIQNVTIPGLS